MQSTLPWASLPLLPCFGGETGQRKGPAAECNCFEAAFHSISRMKVQSGRLISHVDVGNKEICGGELFATSHNLSFK